ncbi:MAG: DUF3857 domain-containing protein [Balneolia bacterium]|nr:DUF3857 domain-containing protein [Balneolia bacterium]
MIIRKTAVTALLTLFALSFANSQAQADRPELVASGINPILLLNNPPVVVRSYDREFTWRSPSRGRMEVRKVVTIMNREGRDYAAEVIHYDSFISASNISGRIYDADGKQVRRIRSRHIEDYPSYSGFSLASDSRYQVVEFHHDSYPYTYEIEYRYDFNGLISFPAWSPLNVYYALEQASYSVVVPENIEIKYAARNLDKKTAEPEIEQSGNQTRYTWLLENQRRYSRGQFWPTWNELRPVLLVQTSEFEFGGFAGKLDEWSDFGGWIHELWDGRGDLPADVEQRALELIDGMEDRHEIIQTLYSFVQQNTRYVSIPLGIGGMQTETATHTARTRYGDCKGLTNYLRSLLAVAGIESYPALIRSGSPHDDGITDIPNSYFNHVILCVPPDPENGAGDDEMIWVEATSNNFTAGYIGFNNAGKNVLVFDENGGRMMTTPELTAAENIRYRRSEISIDEQGNAHANVSTIFGGVQHESVLFLGESATPREQRNFLDNFIQAGDFRVNEYEFDSLELEPGKAKLDLDLTLPAYARMMGNRIFLSPNIMDHSRYQVGTEQNRTEPISLRYPFTDVDETIWQLPENMRPEAMPDNISVSVSFGSYEMRITHDEEANQLVVNRTMELNQSRIDASEFDEFRNFINQATRADAAQVVLVRN